MRSIPISNHHKHVKSVFVCSIPYLKFPTHDPPTKCLNTFHVLLNGLCMRVCVYLLSMLNNESIATLEIRFKTHEHEFFARLSPLLLGTHFSMREMRTCRKWAVCWWKNQYGWCFSSENFVWICVFHRRPQSERFLVEVFGFATVWQTQVRSSASNSIDGNVHSVVFCLLISMGPLLFHRFFPLSIATILYEEIWYQNFSIEPALDCV